MYLSFETFLILLFIFLLGSLLSSAPLTLLPLRELALMIKGRFRNIYHSYYRTKALTPIVNSLPEALTGKSLLKDLAKKTKKSKKPKDVDSLTLFFTSNIETNGMKGSTLLEDEDSSIDPQLPNSKLLQTVIDYQTANPNYIALIRVGDFYELYYDQADIVGDLLGLLVVDKKLKGQLIRFTGFPYTQLERHLETLVNRHGRCVAVLEQFQDPLSKQFDRRVDRIFTPGTLIGEQFLDSTQSNYLLALFSNSDPTITHKSNSKESVGMAWIDLATGDFQIGDTFKDELATEIARLKPKEIVIPNDNLADYLSYNIQISREPADSFHTPPNEGGFLDNLVEKLNAFSSLEKNAGLGLLNYLVKTQGGRDLDLQFPVSRDDPRRLKIDPSVLKCLDINTPKAKTTLLAHLNNTITKSGSRLLAKRLASPSTHIPTIEARLDLMDAFKVEASLSLKVRKILIGARDAQRSLQKISLGHESPQDVVDIMSMLNCSTELKSLLKSSSYGTIRNYSKFLSNPKTLAETIKNALDCEVPKKILGKGAIKPDCNDTLSNLHKSFILLESEKDALETSLKSLLGTKSLKLISSGSLGYFFEISLRDGKLLANNQYQLSSEPLLFQELKGKKRYYYKEWTSLANQLTLAEENIIVEEKEIFKNICKMILSSREEIIKDCQTIAEIDVAVSLAQTAKDLYLVRPKLYASPKLKIQAARHLSVEIALQSQRRPFTPNDCLLDASPELSDNHPSNLGRLWIITGPNMGGKTTFLRKVASIVILAQAGFPVPAESAEIGIVDQIFSRVGSADNLIQEQSTFMVEMQEMSTILHKATYRSLVIVDEIGRGTSTNEGEAIAFAILEYLHNTIRCRTLFATHFHRLAQSTSTEDSNLCLGAARNYHTRVMRLQDNQFSFLHDLLPGASTSSCASLVASLAGIPNEVLERAQKLSEDNNSALSNFHSTHMPENYQKIKDILQSVDLNELRPVNALLLIQRLQDLAKKNF